MEEARAWAADAVEKLTPPVEPKADAAARTHTPVPATTSPDPLIGSVIDRRYRVDALLGKGGMGAVYRGEQVFIHRPVAIKVLHPSIAAQTELVERFRREAEVAVRLRSSNVVEVLDFGQTSDGRFYLAMELLRGESLQSLLQRERRLDPVRVTALLGELLDGLRAVHGAGIVHRDLKPDNLWLATDESGRTRLKLLDFGIAKVAEAGPAQTQLGLVMGTPEYLAPEQALGEPVDHRADLYSVGIIAFVLATGRHPFPAREPRGGGPRPPPPPRRRCPRSWTSLPSWPLRRTSLSSSHAPPPRSARLAPRARTNFSPFFRRRCLSRRRRPSSRGSRSRRRRLRSIWSGSRR